MAESSTPRWQRRSAERPAELLSAAFQLFAEQGFAATRLEDVATRAGVSKATIYRYFENKEALFEAVVKDAVAPRFVEAEALLDVFEGSAEAMLRLLFNVLRRGLAGPFPPMIKLVVAESGNFPRLAHLWVEHVVGRGMALVSRIIARGVESGEFREVDPKTTAPLVAAPLVLLAIYKQALSHTSFELDEEKLLSTHLDMLLRALRPSDQGTIS